MTISISNFTGSHRRQRITVKSAKKRKSRKCAPFMLFGSSQWVTSGFSRVWRMDVLHRKLSMKKKLETTGAARF